MSESHSRDDSTIAAVDVVIPCYNVAETVERTVRSVTNQQLSRSMRLSIYAVDDGSTDATTAAISRIDDPRLIAIRSPDNLGRAAACNIGAAAGRGDVILILDADCVLADELTIAEHLRALATSDVSLGVIRSAGAGFWSEYQNRLVRAGGDAGRIEQLWSYTTANAAFRRHVFEAVGGFDDGFRHYGFEDKEFLARLLDAGATVSVTAGAVAVHEDHPTLSAICRKLQRAAEFSAARLLSRSPTMYDRTPYARLDARLHRWMTFLPTASLVELILAASPALQKVLDAQTLPFALRQVLARACMALCYLHGTRLDAARRSLPAERDRGPRCDRGGRG